MKVLIAVASKHGATRDIAERIGLRFEAAGFAADVVSADAAGNPSLYDAAVVGSGVYAGSWLKPAREYVDRHADALTTMPVWLFSSGPLGDPPQPSGDAAVKVDTIVEQTQPAGHEVLAGAVSKDKLNLGERAIMKAVRATYGDFRDWDAIDTWADTIAADLAK